MTSWYKSGEWAEALVSEKLKELPPEYTVIRNVDIADRGRNSELDTVVVTPTGVIVVLEVKAGSLQSDDLGHIVRDYGEGSQKDITRQLGRQGSIARARLSELSRRLTIRSFLVLPNGYLEGSGIGIDRTKVIEADRFDELCRIIQDCDRLPGAQEVAREAIVEFLQNKCVIRQSISSISETLDVRCRELASGLATWVPRIDSPLAVVEVKAPAGAGKTQLALALLERAASERQAAWYINTTRNIAQKLQELPINQHVDFIGTWHELAIEETRSESPGDIEPSQRARFFDEVSERFIAKLHAGEYRKDCIVIDDAQDLRAEWIVALVSALSDKGTLYVLSDPNFEGDGVEFSESVRIVSNETSRVPQTICDAINELGLAPTPLVSNSPYQGDVPAFFTYNGPAQLLKETRRAVDEARSEGFTDDQIAVLTLKSRHSSEILCSPSLGTDKYLLKQPLEEFKNGRQLFGTGTIFNDTVRRFKGMQAPCVILTELDFEALDESTLSLLYLGMTRASMSLKLVLSETFAQKMAARLQ